MKHRKSKGKQDEKKSMSENLISITTPALNANKKIIKIPNDYAQEMYKLGIAKGKEQANKEWSKEMVISYNSGIAKGRDESLKKVRMFFGVTDKTEGLTFNEVLNYLDNTIVKELKNVILIFFIITFSVDVISNCETAAFDFIRESIDCVWRLSFVKVSVPSNPSHISLACDNF